MVAFLAQGFLRSNLKAELCLLLDIIENDNQYLETRKIFADIKQMKIPELMPELKEQPSIQESYLTRDTDSFNSKLIRYSMLIVNPTILKIAQGKDLYLNINLLYKSIIDLMPLECAEEFKYIMPSIEAQEENLSNEKIYHFNDGIEKGEFKELLMISTKITDLIQIKTIKSFFMILLKNYEEARIGLNFSIEMSFKFASEFDGPIENEIMSYDRIRSLVLLSSYCLSKMYMVNKDHEKSEIIVRELERSIELIINSSDNINTSEERKIGRLESYFLILGNLNFEKFLYQAVTKLRIGQFKRLDDDDKEVLLKAMRHYVLLINTKPIDDSGVFPIYDALLTLIVLYGGLNFRCIWAFSFFKSLRTLRSETVETVETQNYDLPGDLTQLIEDNKHCVEDLVRKESRLRGAEKLILFSNQDLAKMTQIPCYTLEWKFFKDFEICGSESENRSLRFVSSSKEVSSETTEVDDIGKELILLYITTLTEDPRLNNPEVLGMIQDYIENDLGLKLYIEH